MIGRREAMGLLSMGGVALLSGCTELFPRRYRFRMTVEIDTPQGVKTGSGVIEVTARKNTKILADERSGSAGLSGEAVVVDLPAGPLFVLLKDAGHGQPLYANVTRALAPDASLYPVEDFVRTVGELGGGEHKAELPRDDWPLMVRFRDINDPKSVEQVDPEAIGVKRIVLETTDDAVTKGIEKRLRWLPSHNGALAYDGRMHPDQPEKDLNQHAFSTELR